jgi:hypothetical protein
MKSRLVLTVLAAGLAAASAWAKLPPVSDEAKAKAAEAAAKTAWTNKVADYQLCKAADRVAAVYLAEAKKAGKTVTPTPTPPCADPGPFAYTPADPRPIEAAGAHSPTKTAATPPSTMAPAATTTPTPKQ